MNNVVGQEVLRVLIIDDEEGIRNSLSDVIRDEGWVTEIAASGEEGIEKFRDGFFDLVFLDIWLPGIDGLATLHQLKDLHKGIPVVIMSGHGTIETAVKATKIGALDFLEKPLSLQRIVDVLEAVKKAKYQAPAYLISPPPSLVGESEIMRNIMQQVSLVGPRSSWVFVTGENGTGKEVVAKNIHYQSKRRDKPLIAVNCAAIPEDLIENELFGHVKGAFSHAFQDKKGKFELAQHGTLFLDEIGDMSLKTQAKILRILQEQAFERLGDTETINIDVRVIAATNKDLIKEIAAGKFREDLFFRLNVIPIHLPPVRERRGDVPLLVRCFLKENAKIMGEAEKDIEPEAMNLLELYPWPGNVREIKNLIERLYIMCPNHLISIKDLPPHILSGSSIIEEVSPSDSAKATLKEARSDFERAFILSALKENDFNISKTADALGLERSSLHKKIKLYNFEIKDLKA